MKKRDILWIFPSIVWLFCGWLWIRNVQTGLLLREKERGTLLAETLAAMNSAPLQNRLEPLAGFGGVTSHRGVLEAVLSDFHGKILLPLRRFGERGALLPQNRGELLFEKEILGLGQEPLGKASLLFHPEIPPFLFLKFLFLAPLAAVGGFYLYPRFFRKKQKENPAPPPVPVSQNWFPLLLQWTGARLYLADEEGRLLAGNVPEKEGHLLDLFLEPAEAQEVMALFQRAKEREGAVLHSEKMNIGSWREKDGTRYFLLACH